MITLDQVSGCGVFEPLSARGCYCKACERGEGCPVDPKEVALCKEWITEFTAPAKRVCYVFGCIGSYGLKHEVERWTETRGRHEYIANGAFIAAAIELGYEAVPEGINCRFKMRGRV